MKASKKQKNKKPMSLMKKILLIILAVAAIIGIIYLVYYLTRYTFYDKYEDYLTSYEYEEGADYHTLSDSGKEVAGMDLVAENDMLKLYTNTETAEVAVYDKRNGEIIYSNPQDADEDSIANGTNKDYMKSQFILYYYNADVKSGTFDSYTMAVEKGQLEVESIENGVRYIYTLGDFETSRTGNIPLFITPEKLAEIQGMVDEKTATSLGRYYSESETVAGMLELNGVVQRNVKTIAKVQGWFDEIGWTDEQYEEQMALAGVEVELPISFIIPLEYRLNGDSVDVSIPTAGIQEFGGGSVYRIQLLRYMAAADMEEEGYMVVPNSSGSLIHFNNGKTNVAQYSQYIYDLDPISANYTTTENLDSVKLPLFGICRENSSVLATVEDGATIAQITAGVSGVYGEYNYVYPSFTLRTADNLQMFGDSAAEVFVLEPEMYDCNLTVKYTFLTEENKGYAGLAGYYRNRLLAEGRLKDNDTSGDIPFYYDIIGSVKETSHILGVQYLHNFAMTTFDDAAQISDEFAAAGITNQVMNYQGWMNGGYYHDTADKIRVVSKLGGKSGLKKLNQTVSSNGGRFYGDVSFQNVSFVDDGFNYNAEGSRYYGAGYVVSFGLVNPTTLRATSGLGYMENKYDLLSPKYLPRYIDKFSGKITKLDVDGISLRDLGNYLHSDKKRTNVITREEAYDVMMGQWETLEGTGKNLMATAANDYAFAYVTDIINAPIMPNDFFIVDEDIPLYEMIIHGNINYATELLNFYDQQEMTEVILNMIEYGAAPHYVFTWEESSKMKQTALNRYYATTYANWKDEAIDVYNRVNEALKEVSGATMINHEILDSDLRKVTYDNGIAIYVNYGDEDKTADGITIKANSYEMEGI